MLIVNKEKVLPSLLPLLGSTLIRIEAVQVRTVNISN